MAAKMNFGDYVVGVAEEKSIFELLPIVMFDDAQNFSPTERLELMTKVAKNLLSVVILNGLETWFNSISLVDTFDPIQVGFGLVVRPRTVGDAVTVYRNTTLRLHKQAMVDAICRAIEALPFADQDADFFNGYYSGIRFAAATEANLNDFFLLNQVSNPLLKKVTALLLAEAIPLEPFQGFINISELVVLKELRQRLSGLPLDEQGERQARGFLFSLGTIATGALDFAIYDLKREFFSGVPEGQVGGGD